MDKKLKSFVDIDDKTHDIIETLVSKGYTQNKIACELGFHYSSIQRYMRENNIRPAGFVPVGKISLYPITFGTRGVA